MYIDAMQQYSSRTGASASRCFDVPSQDDRMVSEQDRKLHLHTLIPYQVASTLATVPVA